MTAVQAMVAKLQGGAHADDQSGTSFPPPGFSWVVENTIGGMRYADILQCVCGGITCVVASASRRCVQRQYTLHMPQLNNYHVCFVRICCFIF